MRILLISILGIIFTASHQLKAQDYTPTKETVPGISRYKAYSELAKALFKCGEKIAYVEGDYYHLKRKAFHFAMLKMTSFPIVNGDSIELNFISDHYYGPLKFHFAVSDLISPVIEYRKNEYNLRLASIKMNPSYSQEKLWIINGSYEIEKQIADAIFIIKNKDQDLEDQKELENFKPIAQNYRQLIIKPDLNEDARRFLVQATNATEEKKYNDAIDLLEKAIAKDPTYPQAHFNLALLWAQVSIYGAAILEMKKYLMLVPDAADARASQDKIYEWEGKLNK